MKRSQFICIGITTQKLMLKQKAINKIEQAAETSRHAHFKKYINFASNRRHVVKDIS